MSEEELVEHILARLEPQVQDYVEVRNSTTRAQLLQVISKFEERYSSRDTHSSSTNYNRERGDWDVRRMPTEDGRHKNWRNTEVMDRPNDRRDNYRSTSGKMDLRGTRGTMDSRKGILLTGIIMVSKVVTNGISLEIGFE
ncbi:uncharacterized protein TNCV_2546961 [Trichonephila clavipes]|nr:uncharacterized protein TNCV_2546961 [Trichonephila clavipes]